MSGTYLFGLILAGGALFGAIGLAIKISDNHDRRKWFEQYRKELTRK